MTIDANIEGLEKLSDNASLADAIARINELVEVVNALFAGLMQIAERQNEEMLHQFNGVDITLADIEARIKRDDPDPGARMMELRQFIDKGVIKVDEQGFLRRP